MISLKTTLDTILIEQFSKFNNFDGLPECSVTLENNKSRNEFLQNYESEASINSFSIKSVDGKYVLSNSYCSGELTADYKKMNISVSDDKPTYQSTKSIILQLYRYTCIDAGGLLIHSACVQFLDQGILFCGLSGAGKSTQAHLWEKHLDAKAINLDQPYVFVKDGRSYVTGSPFSGKENAYEPVCKPIRAIVFVHQAKENSIKKLSNAEAFSQLYLNNYTYPLNDDIEKKFNENLSALCEFTDLYSLNCDISRQAVEVCVGELFGEDGLNVLNAAKYKRASGYVLREVSGKKLVVPERRNDSESSEYICFNEAGEFIWNCLATPKSAEELARMLVKEYGIDFNCALEDSKNIIEKCVKDRYIVLS